MEHGSKKQRILDALSGLPDDATAEEAIERLGFLAKVEEGIAQLDAGQSVDQEEVKRRVEQFNRRAVAEHAEEELADLGADLVESNTSFLEQLFSHPPG